MGIGQGFRQPFGVAYSPAIEGNLVGWFDMQDTSTYTLTTGSLTTLTNKATSVVWNSTVSTMPTLGSMNGKPALAFNGTQAVHSDSDTNMQTTFARSGELSVFYAAAITDFAASHIVVGGANSGSSTQYRSFVTHPRTAFWAVLQPALPRAWAS